ncbi:MAG: RagB/SusD family nutrient uptake outer membrane protein [Bacteroidales bacterium]
MKNRLYIFILGSVLLLLSSSCDRSYLYPWPPDAARTPEDVWSYYDYTKGFLDAISADQAPAPFYSDVEGYGNTASACDEAIHSDPAGPVRYFTNGVWNPTNIPTIYHGGHFSSYAAYSSPWTNAYMAIRRVNIFLENVDNSALIDDPTNPARAHERTYEKAHAHFLRAFFQFDLFRKYGCFPITIKSLNINDNLFSPKNTLEECYNQIIADCDVAISALPLMWDDNNFGKANKTAAQALKSRVTLYYASPLYQGEFANFGIAANTTGDIERWKIAIKAARAAINENDFYYLMPVKKFNPPYAGAGRYGNQVGLVSYLNQHEIIWGSVAWSSRAVRDEIYNLPAGLEGCYGATNPTQEMVDAFEVVENFNTSGAKAVPFDWSNPQHANNPYANRDPRFYASISYNGLVWGNNASKQYTIDTYDGGAHRDVTNPRSTKTGYYYRKFFSEDYYWNASGYRATPYRSRNEFRVAEMILNYAEAMNEAYGPQAPDPDGALQFGPQNALEAINFIRARVKMPAIPNGLSKEAMREVIKHERRIELCFEGHRMYDLRRWKEGEKLGATIHGVVITPTGFDSKNKPIGFKYQVEKVEDRVWRNCMYWWPIPYTEIVKYEGKLIQNPEW